MGEAGGASFHLPHRSRRMDRALRSLFVFDGPVHGLDRGLHVQEPLTGLFGLAALVGTGEHFNKRSPLLDQSRSRLFEIVGVLFAHNASHGPSLGRLSGATIISYPGEATSPRSWARGHASWEVTRAKYVAPPLNERVTAPRREFQCFGEQPELWNNRRPPNVVDSAASVASYVALARL